MISIIRMEISYLLVVLDSKWGIMILPSLLHLQHPLARKLLVYAMNNINRRVGTIISELMDRVHLLWKSTYENTAEEKISRKHVVREMRDLVQKLEDEVSSDEG